MKYNVNLQVHEIQNFFNDNLQVHEIQKKNMVAYRKH